jgi:hypothetical protein
LKAMLPILLVVGSLVLVGTAGALDEATSSKMEHSTHVVKFFKNHAWLRAPNKPNCLAVPWTRSCRIARKIYQRHVDRLAELKHIIWLDYQYNWESWLPDNWKRVASCETHFNFEHNNSSFVSAFGISWREYNADAAHMGAPPWNVRHTPRDQYMAALGHYDRFGDGWSCPGP